MILNKEFLLAIADYEKQKRKLLNKPTVIRRFICAVGLHKWSFYSKEIEVKKRDLFYGTKELRIGEERLYIYQCECCEYSRVRIKGYTCLGDYDRWEK